jgi:Endonuclease-reverse transcriptase
VELPYWCGKICLTAYYHLFKQKYWNLLAFRSALPALPQVHPPGSPGSHFISTYRPGGRSNAEDIQLLTSSRTSFFICGDLNARYSSWGCARANSAGNFLFECGGDFAIYYPPSPTRIPLNRMQSPSTLDIVLSNGLHELDSFAFQFCLRLLPTPVAKFLIIIFSITNMLTGISLS